MRGQPIKGSKQEAYLLLLKFSTQSALIILSPWLIALLFAAPYLVEGMALPLIMIVQVLLIIPATVVVVRKYGKQVEINGHYQVGAGMDVIIPLAFNFLAGTGYFILTFGMAFISSSISTWQGNTFSARMSPNLIVTIKEESVIEKDQDYRAVLHIENKTGEDLSLFMSIGDSTSKIGQMPNAYHNMSKSGQNPDEFTREYGISGQVLMPRGTSDRTILVSLPTFYPDFCDGFLKKPLHLLYRIGSGEDWESSGFWESERYNGMFILNNKMNQDMQQFFCSTK